MKSSIKIDFAFSNNEPIIKLGYKESDDVRDRLIQSFINKRGYESRTLTIFVNPHESQSEQNYEIYAIEDELEYFKKRIKESYISSQELSHRVDNLFLEVFKERFPNSENVKPD